ncbi:MAG: MFS transporter [Actinomycetales bacterium]
MLSTNPDRLPYAALTGLSTTAALILVTELMPIGVISAMGAALHVSDGRVGFLASAYAGAATVSAIPLTAATRRLPRRPLMLCVLAGFALGNVVTAACSSYGVVLATRVGVGLLGGVAWSMIAGYATGIAPLKRQGRAVAIALAGITVALVVGLPAGTAVASRFGWRATFLGLAAGAVVVGAWLMATLPPLPAPPAGPGARLSAVIARPGVARVLAVTGTVLLGHQAAYTFLALLARHAGVDRPSLVLLAFGASALAGICLTGVLVDRHLRGLTTASIVTVAAALALTGAMGGSAASLVVAVIVWGLAFGGLPTALQAALVRAAGVADATAAGSLQTTVYNIGVAAGSLAGGVVVDGAGTGLLPWVALPAVVVALVLVLRGRAAFGA